MTLSIKYNCTCSGIYDTKFDRECYMLTGFNQRSIGFDKQKCDSLCPSECDYEYYTNTLTQIPSIEDNFSRSETQFYKYFNKFSNVTFDIDRISSLFVYFDDLRVMKLTELEKISTVDLISSIGGCLGLFLGMSIFSLMELIDIFIEFTHFIYHILSKKIIYP